MIPNKIWQTYKTSYEDLPDYIKNHTNSWKIHNPEYEYNFMSDEDCKDFILDNYGSKYLDVFSSLPVGVMRGDMWRYLIIYSYGGIYADLDAICNVPVSKWISEDKKLIVCPENNIHFCQWCFAAEPESKILESVIDVMMERLLNKPQWGAPDFVHYYTGPGVWTAGILKSLQVEEYKNLIDDSLEWNNLNTAKDLGFFCYGGEDWRIFHFKDVTHVYGSQTFNENYEKWIEHPLVNRSKNITNTNFFEEQKK